MDDFELNELNQIEMNKFKFEPSQIEKNDFKTASIQMKLDNNGIWQMADLGNRCHGDVGWNK